MSTPDTIVFFAGSTWDNIAGTDANLAAALSEKAQVIWVDPAVPATHYLRSKTVPPKRVSAITTNMTRFSVIGLPGSSKLLSRTMTQAHLRRQLRSFLRGSHIEPVAVIVASPSVRFPRKVPGTKALIVTDNWTAGAEMMGIDGRRVAGVLRRNLDDADLVTAVSPALVDHLTTLRTDVSLLPNGCSPEMFAQPGKRPADVPDVPYAILAGQINERIDIAALREVIDAGGTLVIVGPRTESDPVTTVALDALLVEPGVEWLGTKSQAETATYVAHAAVGLTPYVLNDFNAQSFPLKTLDYLAAGIPVVSTDLPATRWLATDLVSVTGSAREFGKIAEDLIRSTVPGDARSDERRELAAQHSWSIRADALHRLLDRPNKSPTGKRMHANSTTDHRIDHAILTRFNLPSDGREQRIRLEDGWLEHRWELFTNYCAPSVARQSKSEFSWIIYFDPDTPQWLRDKVDDLSAEGLFTAIYRTSVSREELFADVARATGGRGDLVMTTNLDNDDGLAIDFVERVQAAATNSERRAIYIADGLIRKDDRLYRRTDRHNAFCSVSESWVGPRGCWSTWHNLLANELPVVEVGGPPGWLQVVHGRNVSNRVRGRLTSPASVRQRFPHLLDDVVEPSIPQHIYDLIVHQTARTGYEVGRAAIKSGAVAVFGAEGMAQTRNRMESRVKKLIASAAITSNRTIPVADRPLEQETT